MTQNENRPMVAAIGRVGVSSESSWSDLTPESHDRKASLSAALQGAVFHNRPAAQHEAELRAYRRRTVMQRAKTVLRTGGYLLHVAENGVEQRLTLRQVWKGAPFLSVWVRDGMEVTLTRDRLEGGCLRRLVEPRGAGWEFYRDVRGENSSSWRRPVRVEGATTREVAGLAKRPPRMEGR